MRKSDKSKRETIGIVEYLKYIKQRQVYLKFFVGGDYPLTELKYYEELQNRIKEWGKHHKIAYLYIKGKMSVSDAVDYMGVSERVFYRLIAKQKAEMITFIQETESKLEGKYSFIPFTDEFNDMEVIE